MSHNPLPNRSPFPAGSVSLVGAGPGDPELLTLRAWRRIGEAEVVLHDRLVSPEILELVPETAERYYVGKARSDHSLPQEDINLALVKWAREGKRVVRLKGGDPFIFGRGGEELETLVEAGVTVEVVPGITAASGCSAYAGIPLTHRDHAQSVRFITGHLKEGGCELDWRALASPGQTLVFYMGLGSLEHISHGLGAAGLASDTPVALVEQGTTQRQRVHLTCLGDLPTLNDRDIIRPPTLIIVGSVVSLHKQLAWFDNAQAGSSGWMHGKHPSPRERSD
ncbi:uroporphyrinogen-III C-methyltransferase [Halomonas denitrificans]|uniref:uroporphyrinogen-III C-methyltransferase n=1 Tax=Halomonas TaxID=2745 RepID=UPI001A8D7797|nr:MULTISPECIES: uroporphyrinogen-III C-methyltransferase [Halomonas]MED5296019.1 uroporphyrinogen-III C-methyltransferase [Pseudomonadota bacterium]MBN8414340.1 uroporphyrinogen-III C-methyltransferase [Halomonas litopenaei]MBY5926968.1 uroporphyrinogen-III C-methyltransferase [Halomonas sp. DP4Y7-2]MBY5931035.1 uroporphyrinogen-III C-methyltransferase [Halomonas sp. DP8Y7-3]MBY5968938.1 uroporphyrinogen-III C-methyltransferase [Halomonas denitrificans]